MKNMKKILERAARPQKKPLNQNHARQLLKTYGMPMISETLAPNENEAVKAAEEIGFPVVLKGIGPTLLHKTERGLVHLNLMDSRAAHEAACLISAEAGDELDGFLIQPQIQGRREFVAGLFQDEQFGPVVMFGTGGIFTEAISDVTFRVAPLTQADAVEMLGEIRTKALLGNFRGEHVADQNQLVQVLMGLSRIGMEEPGITEIDINPLVITPKGKVWAVDALVMRAEKESGPSGSQHPDTEPTDPVLLGKLFYPKSIAFVGATAQMGKWGHTLPNITISRGYEGEIWLVNSKGGTIGGRQVCRSVAEIPGTVDLAVVTIPAAGVMDMIPQFREKGIRNMVLITSGFAEMGEAGRELEKNLVSAAKAAGILILGPNTMGISNPHIRLYCTGGPVWPIAGSTSVVAQSGNMGTQLLAFAEQQGIGIRCFAGSGNEAMITMEDYLEALEIDDLTQIIMLYVESVKNGRRFFEVAARVSKKKPIVLLKGGRTKAGKQAAASHTGAMASDTGVFDAVCKQTGIVNVTHPMDMLDLAAAFSSLPLPKGNRVAIMTFGGGWGVVTADMCAEHGLDIPELSSEILERIDKLLPPYWSRANPVDIVGEHDNLIAEMILKELLEWEGCDAVINLGIMGWKNLMDRIGESVLVADPTCPPDRIESAIQNVMTFEKNYVRHIVKLMETYGKPIFGVSMSATEKDQTLYRVKGSRLKGVFYPTPERAVKACAKMYEYQRFLSR